MNKFRLIFWGNSSYDFFFNMPAAENYSISIQPVWLTLNNEMFLLQEFLPTNTGSELKHGD